MKNAIEIQDEYIKALTRISPKDYNYCVIQSKAGKAMRTALAEIGMNQLDAEQAVYSANDMVLLNHYASA
jgi:hypothetical protein